MESFHLVPSDEVQLKKQQTRVRSSFVHNCCKTT